ncbi:MAG: hypothetical protein PHU85_04500 [Phycisphaerae bacterium]|nr:hypothetical protein [Phycisphaerae bacterium]
MPSEKTPVIEMLFDKRWNPKSKALSCRLVTLEDVSQAIDAYNLTVSDERKLSTRNPANFFKDFIRQRKAANRNWPKSVFSKGYAARQRTGNNACFEFIPVTTGQIEPFPEHINGPTPSAPRHQIESASLPLASRRLGRADEPWLVQVLIRLRVIETHLALASNRQILHLDHLQMNVKLRKAEIDAIFLATEQVGDKTLQELIVCCEAKGRKDDILTDQIVRQVQAIFDLSEFSQPYVLPIAVKAIAPSEVYVVEFDAVPCEDAATLDVLTVNNTADYVLTPAVPGIGE